MNERIEKMMLEATKDIPQGYYVPPQYFEKFAELIVKECADICYHHSNAAGGVDTHFGYGYKDCGDDIKRNFGVKK